MTTDHHHVVVWDFCGVIEASIVTVKLLISGPTTITGIKVKQPIDMLKPYRSLCCNTTFVEQNFLI